MLAERFDALCEGDKLAVSLLMSMMQGLMQRGKDAAIHDIIILASPQSVELTEQEQEALIEHRTAVECWGWTFDENLPKSGWKSGSLPSAIILLTAPVICGRLLDLKALQAGNTSGSISSRAFCLRICLMHTALTRLGSKTCPI